MKIFRRSAGTHLYRIRSMERKSRYCPGRSALFRPGSLGKETGPEIPGERGRPERTGRTAEKDLETAQANVKKGGTLLYSTCTIDPMENEENVHWFLKKYPQFSLNSIREKLCPQLAESVEEEGCIQLLPGIHCSDGFFIARLKKNGEN